jgi:HSP20 family protein
MLTRYADFDRSFDLFDELRRRMDGVLSDVDRGWLPPARTAGAWPRVNVYDQASSLLIKAEVPGMTEKDLSLTLSDGSLTITGERKLDAKEGYSVHRQERAAAKFSRSFTLPYKVDAEKTSAVVKDGVLTISLAKTPESQPRQIAVRAS